LLIVLIVDGITATTVFFLLVCIFLSQYVNELLLICGFVNLWIRMNE